MKVVFGKTDSKRTTIKLMFDAGSAVEYKKWTPGVAHLMEHMMFQGSKSRTHAELTRDLATLGAEYNAYTDTSHVAFYVIVPQEHTEKAISILADMMFNRGFAEEDFEKERKVVLEEERGTRDNINETIFKALYEFLCSGPVSMPIIGSEESIRSITFEELNDFYKFYYSPQRLLATITSGNESDCNTFVKYFGSNTGKFAHSKKFPNKFKKQKKKVVLGKVQQPRLFVCYRGVPLKSKHVLNMQFVEYFFSHSLDSRLFQTIRQKHGLCYSVGSASACESDVGWLIFWASTGEDNINDVIRLINDEIKLLLKDGPTEEEMIRARNKYISEIYSRLETSSGLNSVISTRVFHNVPPIETSIERIKNMKPQTLMRTCRHLLVPDSRQVFIYRPEERDD